jgi:hypothetical protein
MCKKFLIVTTISRPNNVLQSLAKGCLSEGWKFIIVGDTKSPPDFNLEGSQYYDIAEQKTTGFQYSELCPYKHYARKNIGYLLAIKFGAERIVETDDDNFPLVEFWSQKDMNVMSKVLDQDGWINVYKYFTDSIIWPRGLPLDKIHSSITPIDNLPESLVCCPIQQGLANQNPDVDAIYRLVLPLPIVFKENIKITLGNGSWCPFNSQNTVWFPPAYPLMYLPAYCSFRMTDIWRSFIAQRICWENGWNVLFHSPTVYQERNLHNLMQDFSDEVPGYINNEKIVNALMNINLKSGEKNIPDNMRICYEKLVDLGIFGKEEIHLLKSWLVDLSQI